MASLNLNVMERDESGDKIKPNNKTKLLNLYVMGRDESDNWTEFKPGSKEHDSIACSIYTALLMMETERGREAMAQLAVALDVASGTGRFSGDVNRAGECIDLFLKKMRSTFPAILIDQKIQSLDHSGEHTRPLPPFTGEPEDFAPRSCMIKLNGKRVDSMARALEEGRRTENFKKFEKFQWMFAIILLHEAGAHVLYTCIGKGREVTPEEITVTGFGAEEEGESGRRLELLLLGGTTEFVRDEAQNQNDDQPGIPYQIDEEGQAWKIDPLAIEHAMSSYDFDNHFPLPRAEEQSVHWKSLERMGDRDRAAEKACTSSERRTMAARLDKGFAMIRRSAGYNVRTSDIERFGRDREPLRAC